VKALPDAVYTVYEANDKYLRYDAKVNDHHLWQYHRNNGFTKLGFYSKELNMSTQILRVIEGHVEAASTINKAYIKSNFPSTTVITGINTYPYEPNLEFLMGKADASETAFLLPFCLCLGLPVFMYSLVLEKEKRLLENMKINGLNLKNYWFVNFVFNYCYYCVTMILFYGFGKYVFKMIVFTKTNSFIMLSVLNGWGLSQISLAFFMSVFIQKAALASIIGYITSIYLMFLATVMSGVIYLIPFTAPWYF